VKARATFAAGDELLAVGGAGLCPSAAQEAAVHL